MNNELHIEFFEESSAQKLGRYLIDHFNTDGTQHEKSAIVIPGYDKDGRLVGIHAYIADAAKEENAFPMFLNAEEASKM